MEIEGLWTIKNHLKKKDYRSAPLRGAEVIINERRARKGKRLHTLHTSAHMVCAPLFVDMTGESDCYTHMHTRNPTSSIGEKIWRMFSTSVNMY